MTDERRQRGLDRMAEVYAWDVQDGPGDFFAITVDHLFAEIWTRPGLSLRDRRLLLIGLLTGQGLQDVADIQIGAALRRRVGPASSFSRSHTPGQKTIAHIAAFAGLRKRRR